MLSPWMKVILIKQLNKYLFIYRQLKDIINPPKAAQMLSENINKQSKIKNIFILLQN